MEYEEMKTVWASQRDNSFYKVNEKSMYDKIETRKRQSSHISNVTELLIITVSGLGGIFCLSLGMLNNERAILYLFAIWMLCTAGYVWRSRLLRIKGSKKFDRSMVSDLEYAIWNATRQVQLSQAMWWNIIPAFALCMYGMWDIGKSAWFLGGWFLFFIAVFFASRREHNFYRSRKLELEDIYRDLVRNSSGDS